MLSGAAIVAGKSMVKIGGWSGTTAAALAYNYRILCRVSYGLIQIK
jgi:hypothetical protein